MSPSTGPANDKPSNVPLERLPSRGPSMKPPGSSQRAVKWGVAACPSPPPQAPPAPSASKPLTAGAPSPIVIPRSGGQKGYSCSREGVEIVRGMEAWAEDSLLPLLKDPATCWQPQDLLPDPASPSFYDDVRALRERQAELPDDYLVCLVGDLITEEALPTYMAMLNTLEGARDETGASPSAWAKWTRAWTAEENRHGDLLNKYLYLGGRVDMAAVERTTQSLVGAGMDVGLENNPYLCFVYTSFQERATKISHRNTARMAFEAGDAQLARVCGAIANDEARHEEGYQRIVEELLRRDPEGAMVRPGAGRV